MLSKLIGDNHSRWPDLLGPVALAYNSTAYVTMGYSLHELFFSFMPSCPLDAMTDTPLAEQADSADMYAFQAPNRLRNAFAFMHKHSGKQAVKMITTLQ